VPTDKPDKQDMLWKATMADPTPNEWPGALAEAVLFVEQMNLTFDSVGILCTRHLDDHPVLDHHLLALMNNNNNWQLRLGRVHAQ
jgi:hypothetical protein